MADAALEKFIARLALRPTCEVRDLGALRDEMEALGARVGVPDGVSVEVLDLAGMEVWRFAAGGSGPVALYLHGGGYVAGSPGSHRHLCGKLALDLGGTVYAPAYRLAPEHPFPAAFEDAAVAFTHVSGLHREKGVAIVGDSAGGGLALACTIGLIAAGGVRPACVVGLSPWLNHVLTHSCFEQPSQDPTLSRASLEWYSKLYRGGVEADDPRISPIFADFHGLPPVLLQVGGGEVLRGDVEDFAAVLRKSGTICTGEVWPGMIHAWHLFWPWLEDGQVALERAARFIATCESSA
ncbi:MAG: hypothetical protein RIS94_1316 [Pseudomonadota bacterium]|jgi:acetyl esterase/lipase